MPNVLPTSFYRDAARCIAGPFGIFLGIVLLYHFAVPCFHFVAFMGKTLWKGIHQFEPILGYVSAAFMATFAAMFCVGTKFDTYASVMTDRQRLLFTRTFRSVYTLVYALIGFTLPVDSWSWFIVVYIFCGISSFALLNDIWRSYTPEAATSVQHNQPNTVVPTSSSSALVEETWEQRFARQSAERRRNAQKP